VKVDFETARRLFTLICVCIGGDDAISATDREPASLDGLKWARSDKTSASKGRGLCDDSRPKLVLASGSPRRVN